MENMSLNMIMNDQLEYLVNMYLNKLCNTYSEIRIIQNYNLSFIIDTSILKIYSSMKGNIKSKYQERCLIQT